jgi:hypothetical protein
MQAQRADAQEAGHVNGTGPYARKWRDLRFRIWLFWSAVVLFPVAILLIPAWLHRFLPATDREYAAEWVAGLWMALVAATGVYRTTFLCPRCATPYFSGNFWQNIFARQCLHCRLPRNGEPVL